MADRRDIATYTMALFHKTLQWELSIMLISINPKFCLSLYGNWFILYLCICHNLRIGYGEISSIMAYDYDWHLFASHSYEYSSYVIIVAYDRNLLYGYEIKIVLSQPI